jgi:hypothetical protein
MLWDGMKDEANFRLNMKGSDYGVYTQNHWVYGFCLSSGIPNN